MSAPLPSTPPRPPQDDAPDPGRARTGRILLWQSVALLGMVLSLSLVLPWKLAALVLGLVALVLGVWLLDEPLTTGLLVGFPLVLLGSVLATWQRRTRPLTTPPGDGRLAV